MRRPIFLLSAAVLIALLTGCEAVDETIHLGMRGPARHNPLLAAQRFCTKMGRPGSSHPGLGRLPASGQTLIIPAGTLNDRGLPRETWEAWLNDGGHLVVLMPDLQFDLRLEPGLWSRRSQAADRMPEILQWTGLRLSEDIAPSAGTLRLSDPHKPGLTHILQPDSGRRRLDTRHMAGRRPDYIGGPPEAASVVSAPYGRGRLSVFADSQWITNPHLGKHHHADLLWAVLKLTSQSREIHLIYANHHSLLDLAISRFGPFLLALTLTVLAWLWMSGRRTGPVQAPQTRSLREFSRHLEATGAFLWRSRLKRDLVRPAQQLIVSRAQKLIAHAADRDQAIIALLAARSRLDPQTIRGALHAEPRDATDLIHLTLLLQKLEQCL